MSDHDDGRQTAQTAAVSVPTFGPAAGELLADRYRVLSTLGIGGTGIVVKAHDERTDEIVAIKLVRDDVEVDEEKLQRFLREAYAAFQLTSQHTARGRDLGRLADGSPYIVMELLDGMDVARLLHANHHLERAFAVGVTCQAAIALDEAHGIGMVHRDIKPSNLFVTWRDGRVIAKVLDFGIAKSAQGATQALTQASSVLGTPAYMSPEQLRSASAVDARTDIWALGAVLYEMVEGHAPFVAHSFAEMCVVVSTAQPQPMTQAPELWPTIARCLAKHPGARYASVAAFAEALAPFREW